MALKHDAQGFLVGEPIDMGNATNELSAIREDTSAMRQSLEELLSRTPAAKQGNAEAPPQIAIRRDFANIRDKDYPQTVKPGGRRILARGQGSPEAEAGIMKAVRGPIGPAVIPSRSRASASAVSTAEGQAPGGPRGTEQIVKELKATRLAMRHAVTPTRRDGRGRFASSVPQPGADPASGPASSPDTDGVPRTSIATGDLAGRIADAVKEAVHGAEDVDPSIKAFQEVAGPLARGFSLLKGDGNGGKERWYRRIFNVLSGFRKDESVANKKTDKRLKAIQEKPGAEDAGGGWWGLILAGLAGIGPALLTGMELIFAKLGLDSLAKLIRGFNRVPRAPVVVPRGPAGGVPAGAPAAGGPAAVKKPGIVKRTWNRLRGLPAEGVPAAAGAPAAGVAEAGATAAGGAAKSGRLARLARLAGRGAKRIPIIGSLITLGLGAMGSSAIEGDDTKTRQQKNAAEGKNWGGAGGGLAGAVAGASAMGTAGAALGSVVPVLGNIIGGVVGVTVGAIVGGIAGEYFGGNIGEVIGEKWETFTATMQSGWEVVRDAGLATWDWARSDIFPAIAAKAGEVWDSLKTTVGDVFASVSDAVKQRWDEVADATKKLVDYARTIPGVAAALDSVEAGRQKAISATTDAIEATANYADEVKAGGKLAAEDIAKAAGSWWDQTKAGASLAVTAAGNAIAGAVPQKLKDKYYERRDATAAEHASNGNKEAVAHEIDKQGITNANERAMFMAQMDHESAGFKSYEESFKYKNADRLMAVSKQARTHGKDAVNAALANGPEAVAEVMYGGRMGNTSPGDAYRYRGRGAIQLTGRENYAKYGKALGIDLEKNPELAAKPEIAAKIAVQYWKDRKLGEKAKAGDVRGVTNVINGGDNGLADRKRLFAKYQRDGTPTVAPSSTPQTAVAVTQAAAPPDPSPVPVKTVVQAPAVATHEAQSESAPPVAVARPAPPIALASIPAVSVPAAPVTVSLSMPSIPAPPKVPAMEEPVQIPMPLASLDSKRPPIKVSLPWQDIGQDLRERGIAHIVTGGLSSSGVG